MFRGAFNSGRVMAAMLAIVVYIAANCGMYALIEVLCISVGAVLIEMSFSMIERKEADKFKKAKSSK